MKKGDLVVVCDPSYSRMVKNGKLVRTHSFFLRHSNKQFVVVETNCCFPQTAPWPDADCRNDTVIQAVDTDEVIFIPSRFLRPVKHTIEIDGKAVVISHESYEALKKSLK